MVSATDSPQRMRTDAALGQGTGREQLDRTGDFAAEVEYQCAARLEDQQRERLVEHGLATVGFEEIIGILDALNRRSKRRVSAGSQTR